MQAAQRTRPMRREDIAEVARLFFSVFRQRAQGGASRARPTHEEFRRYYESVFFDAPFYAPESGGMVALDRDGAVASAFSALPIPFVACGRPVTGRLICAFLADPTIRDNGVPRLSLALQPRHQDLSFTDTASARSAELSASVGAHILPVHGLDWWIPFRPLAARLERGPGQSMAKSTALLSTLIAPLDRARAQSFRPPAATTVACVTLEAFAAQVPAMLERFAIRPDFTRPELTWLLARAAENRAHGSLTLLAFTHARKGTIGLAAVYLRAGRLARVLNVFCHQGHENAVVTALCAEALSRRATGATGLAQPFLLAALSRQRGLRLRPRGHFCVSTRHPDIKEALLRNDIYIGGLAGESWSRLASDWH